MKLASFWRNLSISKKIYGVVGVMALLIALELFTLHFAMQTLSAVRAFVGGEGLWSKAQKSAVVSLQKYAMTGDSADYQAFFEHLRVPMGDRKARLAMLKPNPDQRLIFEGFVEGRIHPADIPGVVRLFTRFHQVPHLKQAIEIWTRGDLMLSELIALATEMHDKIAGGARKAEVLEVFARIEKLDREITALEDDFSYTLGAGSRWLENLLMATLIFAVLTVEGTGLLLTYAFSRNLSAGLGELHTVANEIGQGNFDARATVRSKDELGRLAQSINKMAEDLRASIGTRRQAESASHLKSLFLANMSHEIRTPLTAIIGFTDLLKDPDVTEAERKRYLEIVERTGRSLQQIVDDILDLSKVEAGKIEIDKQDVRLTELLSDIQAVMSVRARDKKISLEFLQLGAVPEGVRTDPLRLRQILMNLVNNAIKFTDHGSVKVALEASPSYLIFTVSDTGRGIPLEVRRRLFQPFSQGGTGASRNQGTGLGLALSRGLAQAMGGDIVLRESEPGRGSTFVLSLPVDAVPVLGRVGAAGPGLTAASELPASGTRILVIDDSADNRLFLQKMLGRNGASVDVASGGAEGVAKAMRGGFDLVLMDMQMPGKDGYQATRELRELGFKSPVIAVTAFAMKEDRDRCLEAGCDDYLKKPIDKNELLRVFALHLPGAAGAVQRPV